MLVAPRRFHISGYHTLYFTLLLMRFYLPIKIIMIPGSQVCIFLEQMFLLTYVYIAHYYCGILMHADGESKASIIPIAIGNA